MKKTLFALAAAGALSMAFAEPFVWPNAWTTAEPGEAQYGGTYRLYDISEIKTFNPAVTDTSTTFTGYWFDQAQLITRGPDSDEFVPYAASTFEVSEDGLTVNVTVRDNLKWSDGEVLDANDYYLTYLIETDVDTGSNGYDSWFIDGAPITVDLIDDHNLVYNFPAPDRQALPVVATSPMPAHIFGPVFESGGGAAVAELWGNNMDVTELVGAGPFVPTVHQLGERLLMERNPHFGDWNVDEQGNALPYLDAVSFTSVTDSDAGLNLYLAGELDAFGPRNLDDIGLIANSIQNGELDAEIHENISPVASSQFIVFNWNKASDPKKEQLFRNADFRRAMSHLTDREAMIDLVYQGSAEPMYSSVYQVYDFWVNNDAPRYEYDPEAALDLLAGIGFVERNANGFLVDADGWELGFTLTTNAGAVQREQIVQIFADAAREIGVNVNVLALDFNLMVGQLTSVGDDRDFDAILIGLTGGNRDWPFGSNVVPWGTNLHMYNMSETFVTPQELQLGRLYYQGRQELDTEAALEIAHELQVVESELAPVIYTVSPTAHASWLSHVRGNFPLEVASDAVGTRNIALTYFQ